MRTALALALLAVLVAPAPAQEIERVPARPGADDPDARAAWAKLDTTMLTVDFQDTPLLACVQFVKQVSGINVVIDPRVAEARALDETRITLEVTDVSLRTVLFKWSRASCKSPSRIACSASSP